jgi:hypothetical protein
MEDIRNFAATQSLPSKDAPLVGWFYEYFPEYEGCEVDHHTLNSLVHQHFSTKLRFEGYTDIFHKARIGHWALAPSGKATKNPLTKVMEGFDGPIKDTQKSRIQKKLERENRKKFGPRNVHWGPAYRSRFFRLHWPVTIALPSDTIELEMLQVAKMVGYGRHKPQFVDPFAIEPKNPQASSGLQITSEGPLIDTKQDIWLLLQHEALKLQQDLLKDSSLDISKRYDLGYLRQIARKYNIYQLWLARTDGGPSKPRYLWEGSGLTYIIEMMYLGYTDGGEKFGIVLDMMLSPFVANSPRKVWNYMHRHKGKPILSSDVSGWDLSIAWQLIVAAIYTIGLLYDIPDEILLYIMASAVAAPVVTTPKSTVYNEQGRVSYYITDAENLEYKFANVFFSGIIRSGTGIFVYANHLIRLYSQWLVSVLTENRNHPGMAYGDDAILSTSASLTDVASLLWTQLNIISKPSSQVRAKDGVTLCKRVFLYRYGKSLPIGWSIVSNMIFPEHGHPIGSYEFALSKRAQLLILENATRVSRAWDALYLKCESMLKKAKLWKFLYNELSIDELSRRASHEVTAKLEFSFNLVEMET